MSNYDQQLEKMKNQDGFIAALDQSGGSTPKALGLYGVTDDAWSNDEEMFTVVHEMRTRIMTSPSFTGERILAAILFENTMDREVAGRPTADYLWTEKNIVFSNRIAARILSPVKLGLVMMRVRISCTTVNISSSYDQASSVTPYRPSAFGVLPPLWSRAAIKPS